MKKFITFLVSVSFISLFSFNAFAQSDDNKIGLNVKTFVGTGIMTVDSRADHPKDQATRNNSDSSTITPAYNASISYTIVKNFTKSPKARISMDLGLGYQYNSIKFIKDEFENNAWKETSYTNKIHQFSADVLVNFGFFKSLDFYLGVSSFPYIKIESVGRSDTPVFAFGKFIGVKYNVCSFMSLILQGSNMSTTTYSVKDTKTNQDIDKTFSLTNVMLGLGFSI